MNYQTIFIIVIIVFFNLLLLNIFRLQNEIYNLTSDKSNKSTNKSLPGLLNEIASQVPIDINKIEKSKDILLPKYKQIKHT